ncbi:probable E3 ubiquitin-protein ligase makorin-1 [Ambystoma mexicanum]|uniref:probable E3 ubiquitin-protein ligase makorin-1 n=1 Tax=Ambystoma mexicanum TaxID=8296 RepID=UPI0037E8CB6D
MEPGLVAGSASEASVRGVPSRVPCRNFSRGACRWGQTCRFSHDRKSSQICRHFQNGFCCYGDRCSYQHVPPPHGGTFGSRRSSEPAIFLQPATFLPSHHGSDPLVSQRLPLLSLPLSGLSRARRGSAPTLPSVSEVQRNHEPQHTEVEEVEESTGEGTSGRRQTSNWALAAEFIPRHTLLEGSRTRQHGLQRSVSDPSVQQKSISQETRSEYQGPGYHKPAASSPGTPHKVVSGKNAASAFEQSKEVSCGICMDKVYEKALPHERLFGILPKCNHSYCVGCIRKWRKTRDFQTEVIKGCPQCRIKSSYFIPNKYWIVDAAEKEKLVQTFTNRTSKIRCRFFVRGHGHCPFKSDCIYLHELPPGHQPRRRPAQRRASATLPYHHFVDLLVDDDDDDDDFNLEEDFYLLQCAVALAILERSGGLDYDHDFEIMLGGSDSD